MASIGELQAKITENENVISAINSIKPTLDDAYNALTDATTVGNYFSIDGESVDRGKISNERNNISNIKSGIETSITSLNAENESMRAEIRRIEEEERRRREEEEKRRKDEEEKKAKASAIAGPKHEIK